MHLNQSYTSRVSQIHQALRQMQDIPEPATVAKRHSRVRQTPKIAPTTLTAAIPAMTAPMTRPMWEELPSLPLLEVALGVDLDAELTRTLSVPGW